MRYVNEDGLLKKELADIVPVKFTGVTGIFDAIRPGQHLRDECIDFVYRFYYRSSKRRRDLKQIGDINDEDVAYFSAPKGTRWMASRQRAYSALRQNLAVVCANMEEASTGKGKEAAKCKGYLR